MKKKKIEDEINEAVNFWDIDRHVSFLQIVGQCFELFNIDENEEWLKNDIEKEHHLTVRLIRTVYLISKIAEMHAGGLVSFKVKFPRLWERLEKMQAKD